MDLLASIIQRIAAQNCSRGVGGGAVSHRYFQAGTTLQNHVFAGSGVLGQLKLEQLLFFFLSLKSLEQEGGWEEMGKLGKEAWSC